VDIQWIHKNNRNVGIEEYALLARMNELIVTITTTIRALIAIRIVVLIKDAALPPPLARELPKLLRHIIV
jgi:hypothetical protein